MKTFKPLSIAIILSAVIMITPSKSFATSLSEAERLVQQAENAATVLKWEISLEHRKIKYSDPVTLPNMDLYNAAKHARQLAYNAINNLPAQEKVKLTKRMEINVDSHFNRSMAYIDALTSGRKIMIKTDDFYEVYRSNPLSDRSEQAYHELSSEIRKQALLLYRVYGKSTRDAILEKYKSPGEKARQSAKSVISAKIAIDHLNQSIANKKNKDELLLSAKQIESTVKQIDDENTRLLVQTKLDAALRTIQGNTLPETESNKDFIEIDVGSNGESQIDKSFMYLSDLIREAVIHPSQPIIYMLNENKDVLELNYETGKVRKLTMNLVPERMYLYKNELYVTLLRGSHSPNWSENGAIAIIDTTAFTLADQFNIEIDPYDIVADGKSIYVSSGSGQWSNIKGFSRETLLETSQSSSSYHQSFLEMHPNLDKLYVINTTVSPRDVSFFTIEDGKLGPGYDSPYHGDYPLETNMTISPDGKYIFNGSGVIMNASEARGMNMSYVTKLYVPFEEITFNMNEGYFYTSNGKNLDVYNYNTMEREKRYVMNGEIQNVFYQNGKLVILSVEQLYSSKLPKYAIKTYRVEGNRMIE
ncbi:hypothetical protein [Cytobacillus praedii]|uniref:hypothetical protein n=1 Tax=Cytobacillus praedii TaxID=1742358 RepID=UPI002E20C539|nr:hypothetical protein [Cytobacillus praedii]